MKEKEIDIEEKKKGKMGKKLLVAELDGVVEE